MTRDEIDQKRTELCSVFLTQVVGLEHGEAQAVFDIVTQLESCGIDGTSGQVGIAALVLMMSAGLNQGSTLNLAEGCRIYSEALVQFANLIDPPWQA